MGLRLRLPWTTEEPAPTPEPEVVDAQGRRRTRPNTYWHDQVGIGVAEGDDLVHRVVGGYMQPVGTPLGTDIGQPAAFETACGLALTGQSVHAVMNDVDCAACWEVPLISYDRAETERRIIGRRDSRR